MTDGMIAGVILAGGLARRMGGGDKTLLPLAGRPILAHVAERLRPQVDRLALNANGPAGRFAAFGLPVLADAVPGHLGPLAGVLAAMDWAAGLGAEAVVTAPGDAPFLPPDLVARLRHGAGPRPVVAAGPARWHPTFGLWPVALRGDLRAALASGTRRVTDWARSHDCAVVPFPDEAAFLNVNEPGDLARAEAAAGR